jgi:uncharacterized protein (DUF697 family)
VSNAERTSLLTIALLAAMAGERSSTGRDGIAESLAPLADCAPDLPQLARDAARGRVTPDGAVRDLNDPALHRLAFELAIDACNADRLRNADETLFLARLGGMLGLPSPAMSEAAFVADALATMPLDVGRAPTGSVAELDELILDYATAAGALALQPGALASLAIAPLQMKLLYRVGKAYGVELGKDAIYHLLVAMGIGPVVQYVQHIGQKLIGNLFDGTRHAMGADGQSAECIALPFANTWAAGKAVERHLSGGGAMTPQEVTAAYRGFLSRAKELQVRCWLQIASQARAIEPEQVVRVVRSQ